RFLLTLPPPPFFFSPLRRPPSSTLFPYTTLFRSLARRSRSTAAARCSSVIGLLRRFSPDVGLHRWAGICAAIQGDPSYSPDATIATRSSLRNLLMNLRCAV